MMKRIYVSLLISICTIMAQAQTIAGYEYWFDNHSTAEVPKIQLQEVYP